MIKLRDHRTYLRFIEKINIKVGLNNMQYKRGDGRFVNVAIYQSVGEDVIQQTIKSFTGFGFKVERTDAFGMVRLLLSW